MLLLEDIKHKQYIPEVSFEVIVHDELHLLLHNQINYQCVLGDEYVLMQEQMRFVLMQIYECNCSLYRQIQFYVSHDQLYMFRIEQIDDLEGVEKLHEHQHE